MNFFTRLSCFDLFSVKLYSFWCLVSSRNNLLCSLRFHGLKRIYTKLSLPDSDRVLMTHFRIPNVSLIIFFSLSRVKPRELKVQIPTRHIAVTQHREVFFFGFLLFSFLVVTENETEL